jgi:hypothetical protein
VDFSADTLFFIHAGQKLTYDLCVSGVCSAGSQKEVGMKLRFKLSFGWRKLRVTLKISLL